MSETGWKVEPWRGRWCVARGDSGHRKIFASREGAEAAYAEMEANGTCRECGDVLSNTYMEPYKSRIVDEQVCFSCMHWWDLYQKRDEDQWARIDGTHYQICPDKKTGFKGFGGRRFHIRFHDGREVVTHNLWTQGTIPPHFRDRLPDNAEFAPFDSEPERQP